MLCFMLVCVALKVFWSAQIIAKLWDVGQGGGDSRPGKLTAVPGETALTVGVTSQGVYEPLGAPLQPEATATAGGGSGSASYPVDNVRQAKNDVGFGDGDRSLRRQRRFVGIKGDISASQFVLLSTSIYV